MYLQYKTSRLTVTIIKTEANAYVYIIFFEGEQNMSFGIYVWKKKKTEAIYEDCAFEANSS